MEFATTAPASGDDNSYRPIMAVRSASEYNPDKPKRPVGVFLWIEGDMMKTGLPFTLVQYLAVAAAGALGAVLRLVVGALSGHYITTRFPVGTLIINLTGSFFLGWFLTVISGRIAVSDTVRLAIGVGFVGAYTTFSTYIYESSSLLADGSGYKAFANLIGSMVLGLIAVRSGIWLGSR